MTNNTQSILCWKTSLLKTSGTRVHFPHKMSVQTNNFHECKISRMTLPNLGLNVDLHLLSQAKKKSYHHLKLITKTNTQYLRSKDVEHILINKLGDISVPFSVAQTIEGVVIGFKRRLYLKGVGYKMKCEGRKLILNLGKSHKVNLNIPSPVSINKFTPTKITLNSYDKKCLCDFIQQIKNTRLPDVYKLKGVREKGEKLRQKEGKKA